MNYTLHLGDCLEVMPTLPDGSVDAIISDWPYGVTSCKWDSVIPLEPLWKEVKRVIKPGGAIVLTASQPFATVLIASSPYFGTNKQWFKYEWVWIKEKPVNIFFKDTQPLKYHENVLVFSEYGSHNMSVNKMKYYPQMECRAKQNKRNNNPRVNRNNGVFGNRVFVNNTPSGNGDLIFPRSYQFFNTDRASKLHPTQKPVALLEYLIKTYTNPSDLVLDNTMGSGSTGVACLNTSRRFIGIEKDPGYFEIAQNRLERVEQELREVQIARERQPYLMTEVTR